MADFDAPPGPPSQMPSSNIGWAIASLLLFWPLAIPSLGFPTFAPPS